MFSANVSLEEEDVELTKPMMAGTVAMSLIFAIGLFFVVPVLAVGLVDRHIIVVLCQQLGRGRHPPGHLCRLPGCHWSHARHRPCLCLSRRRAHDDQWLRGGRRHLTPATLTATRGRTRAAVPPSFLRCSCSASSFSPSWGVRRCWSACSRVSCLCLSLQRLLRVSALARRQVRQPGHACCAPPISRPAITDDPQA